MAKEKLPHFIAQLNFKSYGQLMSICSIIWSENMFNIEIMNLVDCFGRDWIYTDFVIHCIRYFILMDEVIDFDALLEKETINEMDNVCEAIIKF